jgi:hypothetical protein
MIYKETKECVICGAQGEFMWIASTNQFGMPDLDLRPAEMFRSTICWWIQRCPGCGFCAPDISKKGVAINTVKRIIQQDDYRLQLNDSAFPVLANSFLCHSITQEKMVQYHAAAVSCMHAAWSCDDAGMKAASIICRQRAIKMIDKARSAGQLFVKDADTEIAIEIDLLRRSGQFHKALLFCEEYISHNPASEIISVVRFQKSLIERQDDGCHSLDEIRLADSNIMNSV